MRLLALAVLLALPAAAPAREGAGPVSAPAAPPTRKPEWQFSASASANFARHGRDYGQPTVIADRGGLHLEARYNSEALETGSAWVGWNLAFGRKVRFEATLMAGGVFGAIDGIAPGYEVTITWGRLTFSNQGEYVFDLEDRAADYFYNWAQLGYSPFDWLSAGFATQRTRVYDERLGFQPGFFVGSSYRAWSLTVSVFNPGERTQTVVCALAVGF